MPNATDLASAIENLRKFALDQFNAAYTKVTTPPNPAPVTDDDKRKAATELATAQSQMQASLQQLAHLEVMKSDRRGRDGYEAAVKLMEGVQAAAKDVLDKLKPLTDTNSPNQSTTDRINILLRMLDELSRVAPVALWQQASSSSGA